MVSCSTAVTCVRRAHTTAPFTRSQNCGRQQRFAGPRRNDFVKMMFEIALRSVELMMCADGAEVECGSIDVFVHKAHVAGDIDASV